MQDVSLVMTIALCNCAIAIFVLAIAMWMRQLRRSAIALAECCQRWERDSAMVLRLAPEALDRSLDRIERIRQLYRYQSLALDRIQGVRLFWGIVRSVILKRRVKG
jgi:hypothetical protein